MPKVIPTLPPRWLPSLAGVNRFSICTLSVSRAHGFLLCLASQPGGLPGVTYIRRTQIFFSLAFIESCCCFWIWLPTSEPVWLVFPGDPLRWPIVSFFQRIIPAYLWHEKCLSLSDRLVWFLQRHCRTLPSSCIVTHLPISQPYWCGIKISATRQKLLINFWTSNSRRNPRMLPDMVHWLWNNILFPD